MRGALDIGRALQKIKLLSSAKSSCFCATRFEIAAMIAALLWSLILWKIKVDVPAIAKLRLWCSYWDLEIYLCSCQATFLSFPFSTRSLGSQQQNPIHDVKYFCIPSSWLISNNSPLLKESTLHSWNLRYFWVFPNALFRLIIRIDLCWCEVPFPFIKILLFAMNLWCSSRITAILVSFGMVDFCYNFLFLSRNIYF